MTDQPSPTPSMDDKETPSPPIRNTQEYLMDCELGIQRIGKPLYFKGGVLEQ